MSGATRLLAVAPNIGTELQEKDIVAEPFTAWRAWKLRPPAFTSDYRLYPWGIRGYCWLPGENRAQCLAPFSMDGHKAPDPKLRCRCGFWGFKSEEILFAKIHRPHLFSPPVTFAWGKVTLWGRVIEGTLGYRAQYARIAEVKTINSGNRVVEQLASHYGVPVTEDTEYHEPKHKHRWGAWRGGAGGVPLHRECRECGERYTQATERS